MRHSFPTRRSSDLSAYKPNKQTFPNKTSPRVQLQNKLPPTLPQKPSSTWAGPTAVVPRAPAPDALAAPAALTKGSHDRQDGADKVRGRTEGRVFLFGQTTGWVDQRVSGGLNCDRGSRLTSETGSLHTLIQVRIPQASYRTELSPPYTHSAFHKGRAVCICLENHTICFQCLQHTNASEGRDT